MASSGHLLHIDQHRYSYISSVLLSLQLTGDKRKGLLSPAKGFVVPKIAPTTPFNKKSDFPILNAIFLRKIRLFYSNILIFI